MLRSSTAFQSRVLEDGMEPFPGSFQILSFELKDARVTMVKLVFCSNDSLIYEVNNPVDFFTRRFESNHRIYA